MVFEACPLVVPDETQEAIDDPPPTKLTVTRIPAMRLAVPPELTESARVAGKFTLAAIETVPARPEVSSQTKRRATRLGLVNFTGGDTIMPIREG
jgi:hypothetical protein